MAKRARSADLRGCIAGLDDPDHRARLRACAALVRAAEAGQDVSAAVAPLTRRLKRDSVLVWIATCQALRAAARQGLEIARARVPLHGLVDRPPRLEDQTLARELRLTAVTPLTHVWLAGDSGARSVATYLRVRPELRLGIARGLRDVAEAGRLRRSVLPSLADLLTVKEPAIAADAAAALRAYARAGPKEATFVLGALARLKRPNRASRALVTELEATGARAARIKRPARAPVAAPLDELPPRAPRLDDEALSALPRLTTVTCRAAERGKIASLEWSPPRCRDLLAALRFPNAVSLSVWILPGRPLQELVRGAAALPRLQRLTLRGLDAIPDEVALLRRLYDLELEGRVVSGLPAISPALGRLSELERLTIRESQATELPEELCELASLRRLRLSMLKLRRLPARLARLARLEEIDLDTRDRFDVDDALKKLVKLPRLRLLQLRCEPSAARERLLTRAGFAPGSWSMQWVRDELPARGWG